MLPEDIQRLVHTTPRQSREIIQLFEVGLQSLVGYSIKVSKPIDKSRLTDWEYDCPAAPDVFGKPVKENIQDIVTYMQQLGKAQELHLQDIKLLLEAITKYFLCHSEYPFQENDFELRPYLSKALRKPTFSINKEPQWVL